MGLLSGQGSLRGLRGTSAGSASNELRAAKAFGLGVLGGSLAQLDTLPLLSFGVLRADPYTTRPTLPDDDRQGALRGRKA